MADYKALLKTCLIMILLIVALSMIGLSSAQNETDSDSDGMVDTWEEDHELDPNNATDAEQDNDSDGLTNLQEYNNGTNSTDPNDPDTDGGGVDDGTEINQSFNPLDPSDDEEIDTDNDGMPDIWEDQYNLNATDPEDAKKDADNDGYNNLHEFNLTSDPNDPRDPIKEPADGDGDGSISKDDKEMPEEAMGFGTPICLIILVVMLVVLIIIIFFYTKMRREQMLEHAIRNNIFEYINKHPGVHYRGVMNDLNLHMGVLTHHINMLEQQQFIKSIQDGMYRRFYPYNYHVGTTMILSDIQRTILKSIQTTPGVSQTGLGKKLDINRKLIHYHIKILTDAGFVFNEADGRESKLYYLGGLDLNGSEEKKKGSAA